MVSSEIESLQFPVKSQIIYFDEGSSRIDFKIYLSKPRKASGSTPVILFS